MALLEIKNLHVEVEDKKILNGLTLTIEKGQVAAIMGPNGSGKSTLAYVLAGKDNYHVTEGDVLLDGESILGMAPDERAAKGVFLAFQYPVEVPGVATMTFLRTALNAQRKHRGEPEFSTPEFMKRVRETSKQLGIDAGDAAPGGQCRLLRRREEAQRDSADGGAASRGSPCSTRPIPASTSTRSRSCPKASTGCARRERSMIVITHYQRLLELHRARRGARDGQGPGGEIGRQGAGARTRSLRLRAIRGRGGLMNVELRATRRPRPSRR